MLVDVQSSLYYDTRMTCLWCCAMPFTLWFSRWIGLSGHSAPLCQHEAFLHTKIWLSHHSPKSDATEQISDFLDTISQSNTIIGSVQSSPFQTRGVRICSAKKKAVHTLVMLSKPCSNIHRHQTRRGKEIKDHPLKCSNPCPKNRSWWDFVADFRYRDRARLLGEEYWRGILTRHDDLCGCALVIV